MRKNIFLKQNSEHISYFLKVYKAPLWRTGTTTLCQSQLYPPVKDLWIWPQNKYRALQREHSAPQNVIHSFVFSRRIVYFCCCFRIQCGSVRNLFFRKLILYSVCFLLGIIGWWSRLFNWPVCCSLYIRPCPGLYSFHAPTLLSEHSVTIPVKLYD